ncbi:hypothetical protein ABZW47_31245 [Streptomyces sp. NPDC004549]
MLNEAGRGVLAGLCGVREQVLARASPAFAVDEPQIMGAGTAPGEWIAA